MASRGLCVFVVTFVVTFVRMVLVLNFVLCGSHVRDARGWAARGWAAWGRIRLSNAEYHSQIRSGRASFRRPVIIWLIVCFLAYGHTWVAYDHGTALIRWCEGDAPLHEGIPVDVRDVVEDCWIGQRVLKLCDTISARGEGQLQRNATAIWVNLIRLRVVSTRFDSDHFHTKYVSNGPQVDRFAAFVLDNGLPKAALPSNSRYEGCEGGSRQYRRLGAHNELNKL